MNAADRSVPPVAPVQVNASQLPPDQQLLSRAMARALVDIHDFKADPWFAIKRGWVYTVDEKPPPGLNPVRPLAASPHLEGVTRLWLAHKHGLLFKSRQIQMSWLFAYLHLWDALVHDGRHGIIQGKRLDDVDAANDHRILGRARFIRKHLPAFLVQKSSAENTSLESYVNGSTLEAIPEGPDIVRGKVPSAMFCDELGFQENGGENWDAAVPSAAKLWGVSTPNGHEFMYRQADHDRPWDTWRTWPELYPGIHGYVNRRGVLLVFVHYTADPTKRTKDFQDEAPKGYTDYRRYLREMEGNFTLHEGLGVFANEFSEARHVVPKYVPNARAALYRGWDFGYNGQAVSFAQFNNEGQLAWFDQVIYKAVPLEKVIQEVMRRTAQWMAEARGLDFGFDPEGRSVTPHILDYGDPSAGSHNSRGETDRALLSKFNIKLISKRTTGRKRDLVDGVRHLLLPRSDGRPGLIVAKNTPEMHHVIAGLSGGYHYNKPPEGKAERELPEKDGFYDHIFDGFQYLVDSAAPIRYAYRDEGEADWWQDKEVGVGHESYGA